MNCKHLFRPTLVGLAVLAAASSASAQRAFDAVVPELGVRFLADKTMANGDPFPKTDGDNCFARVLPAPSEWVRIDGVPGPVGWMLRVHVFPDLPREGTTSDREHLVDSFEEFVTEADPRLRDYEREFELRGVAVDGKPGHALWRWTDTWKEPKAQETPCFHHVAAVYEIDGREVVLLGFAPANDARSRHPSCEALETMVASLERWSGKAKDPGFSFYNVAASCRVGDREIGIMVSIPCGPEPKPDRKLLDVTKRMVQSLEPESADK